MTRPPQLAAPIGLLTDQGRYTQDATKLRSVITAERLKMDFGIALGRLYDHGRHLMPFDRQGFPFLFDGGIRSVASAVFARQCSQQG